MAANGSYLSDPQYGYDVVVAATEASVNATMLKYLLSLKDQHTYLCYVQTSSDSEPHLIPYADLLSKAQGSDPFKIKDAEDPKTNQDIKNLAEVGFVAGVKISLGVPSNYAPGSYSTLPKIVELQRNATVKYRMMCADITIVELIYDRWGSKWRSLSQSDEPNRCWNLVSDVNLLIDNVDKSTPYANLPPAVQNQINNLSGSMFDIQQLLFDLNNAGLSSVPKIEGIVPNSKAAVLLSSYFVNTYFDAVQKAGAPVLNYTIVPRTQQEATLKPTSLNFHIGPLLHETDTSLKTLDYLCAVNNKKLPAPRDFGWDYISAADAQQAHGVIVINRNTFAEYLRDVILKQAKELCFIPHVRSWNDQGTQFECNPEFNPPNMVIDTNIPSTGETILTMQYDKKAEDENGAGGALGAIVNECHFSASVVARGNALHIESSYRVHLYLRNTQTTSSADVIHKIYHDKVELAVDGAGRMEAKKSGTFEDKKYEDKANAFMNFWAGVNADFDKLKVLKYSGSDFEGLRVQELQNFIFPGGKTFAFKAFHFSDHQDLVASITYADPA
ncbi:hypothetical protein QQS21_009029 [Conoideocrella luteorostrata]|uniref:Uncharacterized protein n=1 Tax=Conoideocrella luteorostrata TaxID=1105319 RepID=A0AAJ0FVF2_9HYPO|nr:hypothetical protein QQS21_009029 [Conoideocrella luteorostrata]